MLKTVKNTGQERGKLQEAKYHNAITEAVGNTPLVKLKVMTAEKGIKANMLVKLEFYNPTASIKDRMAIYVLEKAAAEGELKAGAAIIEGTSGNTGAAVAMYAAANGHKSIITITDKMSKEKIDTLKAFGAEVHVCPATAPHDSPESYYETAGRLHRENPGSFYLNQYFNPVNIEAHYKTTGPEIWEQTGGKIDVLVGGIGTGGTLSGAGKYLKEQNHEIEIIAVDPVGSVFYQYHKDRTMIEPELYQVEGIGEEIICSSIDFSVIDKIYQVTDKDSFVATRDLTRKEGIFAGGSSGAAVHVAMKHAADFGADKTVVTILPDSGLKYISKVFNDEWMREKGFLD
jgi:cystathionine beta-synthase